MDDDGLHGSKTPSGSRSMFQHELDETNAMKEKYRYESENVKSKLDTAQTTLNDLREKSSAANPGQIHKI